MAGSTQKSRTITVLQCAMSVGTTVIGVGVLAFPRITVDYTSTGAPLVTIAGVLIIALFGAVLAIVGSKHADKNVFEYADVVVGRWIGSVFTVAITLYFMELSALAAREFGEVVVTSVLQRTPVEITILIMLVLAATAARNNVTVVSRILTFYMPLVYFPALIIVLLTLKSAKYTNILPVFAVFGQTSISHVFTAALVVASLFQNYFVLGLLVPHMYRPRDAWKGAVFGILAAGAVYVIVVYAVIAVFGTGEIKSLIWPTLELAKTAALPLLFVERMDPIFLAVWVTAVFSAILASYYVAMKGMQHLFGFQNQRVFTIMILPVVYMMAMQSPNIVKLYATVQTVGLAGLVLTGGYPLLLMVVHFLRNPRAKQKGARGAA